MNLKNEVAQIAYAGTNILEDSMGKVISSTIDAESLTGEIELSIEYGADSQGELDIHSVHAKFKDRWVDIADHISDELLYDLVKSYELEP